MVRWIRKIGGTVRTTTIPPPPNPPLAQMTDSLKRMKANQESEDEDEADESAASSDSGQSGEDGNNGRRGKDYRPKRFSFVAIWPLERPYVTASANAFTPEFENHFTISAKGVAILLILLKHAEFTWTNHILALCVTTAGRGFTLFVKVGAEI